MKTFAALLALVSISTSAHALVLCTMPDGKTYVGDTPPPNCEVKQSYASPPAEVQAAEPVPTEAADDGFSVASSNARRKIEREMKAKAERLAEIRKQIAAVNEEGAAYSEDLAAVAGLATGTNPRDAKAAASAALRTQEHDTLASMAELWTQFDDLSAKVKEHSGGSTPVWWRSTLSCEGCPSRGEIESSLK